MTQSGPTSDVLPVSVDNSATITAQYIRLSMFVLVVILAGAIVSATLRTGGRLEGSISDYFHTPARFALVAVLVAIGICLMALYSSDPVENFLLNTAGAMSPIIGFAATTQEPGSRKPFDFDVTTGDVDAFATTTLPAYFAGLAVLAVLVFVVHPTSGRLVKSVLTVVLIFGLAIGTLLLWRAEPRKVHAAAAIGFFLPLIILVLIKAFTMSVGSRLRRVYGLLALLMVASGVWYFIDRIGDRHWEYATLVVEVVLIACFAVFWLLEYVRIAPETPELNAE